MGIGLNSLQYGVLYLGSYYNTGPYINFPHFGNSNLGKLPCKPRVILLLTFCNPVILLGDLFGTSLWRFGRRYFKVLCGNCQLFVLRRKFGGFIGRGPKAQYTRRRTRILMAETPRQGRLMFGKAPGLNAWISFVSSVATRQIAFSPAT